MTRKGLITNASKAYVIASYLRELFLAVGEDLYLTGYIRQEHGSGQGFFGLSNTGSNDCLKETLRRMTDGLNLQFKTFDQIRFTSESCRNLVSRSKAIHVIEHTFEIIDQFHALEKKFIIEGTPFTANSLARWFIENQIVCLVRKAEQTGRYSEVRPFEKYSASIYRGDENVSDWSHDQIRHFNLHSFSKELSFIDSFDFTNDVSIAKAKLIQLGVKHRLPPMAIAMTLNNDDMSLLDVHYLDKVTKVTTPSSKYFKQKYADKWREWKSKNYQS
jgi:hypothetical protein